VSLTERKRQFKTIGFLFLLSVSLIFPFIQNNFNAYYEDNNDFTDRDFIRSSGQRAVTSQWIKNPTFESPIEPIWYWENGTDGDNSDMDATTSTNQANYEVLGETRTFTVVSGIINSSTSPGWEQFNKTGFLLPDEALLTSEGCYVSHFWNDGPNQFPSAQWRTNLSIPIDMSDYIITSASLEVIVNASVDDDVDTPLDDVYWENFAIGDSVTFYSQISDLDYNAPLYTVASNKTKYLGQWHENATYPSILTIDDNPLETVAEIDLITALNSAFEKDPSHSNFTLTLGIDIYSEDNLGSADPDHFDDLFIKTCNLTFTVKKKIDQSTTLSWNQVGNTLDSASVVTDAKFFFEYRVNNTWPSSAPLSEIIFYLNDKSYDEGIIKLSSATTSWKDAKVGGFDVTSLISTGVNITTSIEVFLKDTFELGQAISISIRNVYLNISYIETFQDYGTDLELYLDDIDKTFEPVPGIQIPIDHMLNLTVTYKDNVTGNHISADIYTLEGKVSGNLTEDLGLEQYYFMVNSTELGLGSSVLTVSLQKTNYESQSIQVLIEVVERKTNLRLFINSVEKFEGNTTTSQYDEFLDITISYTDDNTTLHIDGASVEILGIGYMDEDVTEYNYTLNTNNLTQGVNVITIFAQRSNYQSQTIQFFINIEIRSTYIELYVEEEEYDGEPFSTPFGVSLNVTVFFRDVNTTTHLTGANVELISSTLTGAFAEIGNQFNYTINTNDLEKGPNVLTIIAQLDGYQPQTIQLFLNVKERDTELILLVNDESVNKSGTVSLVENELVNITVFYEDYLTRTHLSGANVELHSTGVSILNETNSQFNITINTNDLDKGPNVLTIFAQLINYQPKSFSFVIDVTERPTLIELFLNGNRTVSPVLEVPIGSVINITVKFYDFITRGEIPSAWLQLRGQYLTENLTEGSNQYYIIVNSTNLWFGDNKFTIVAQAPTFQINTSITIMITVNSISTTINTMSDTTSITPGENFLIQVNLSNNDFGGIIKNANVTYSWANGQGFLSDSNNDGIYEATLNSVPAGTYRIRIYAYAGVNYDFSDDFEIVLNVVAPTGPDITIIIISLTAGLVGLTVAFVLYQKHFRYPAKVRMMRKLRKKIGKGKKVKPLTVSTRDNIITGKIERNREILQVEKENSDKNYKKSGGDSLE